MKMAALLCAAVLVTACFLPWVHIESKNFVITGVDTTGTNFGKPGYLHFILAGLTVLFLLMNKAITQKISVFFAAFNIAWAVRNFIIISSCQMGDCPEKEIGIYLLIPFSILLLISVLFWKSNIQPLRKS